VKIRGYRIELGDIEAALRSHPSISNAVVVKNSGLENGEGVLNAYVSLRTGSGFEAISLRAYLAKNVPSYMVPDTITVLKQLPYTRNGKIDRRSLPEPPKRESVGMDQSIDWLEEFLAHLWCARLRVDVVNRDDNFFELGGHSITGAQIMARVSAALNVDVTLQILFDHPTVAKLAAALSGMLRDRAGLFRPPITVADRNRLLPLSHSQLRLWFLDHLAPGQATFNLVEAVSIRGPLNISALEQSLSEIIRRHEILRTSFPQIQGEPHQLIQEPGSISLPVTDISGEEREIEIQRVIRRNECEPFDLARGPLIRNELLRISNSEFVLVTSLHHIVFDAWSSGVLLRELASLYEAYVSNRPSSLSELSIQYGDYAAWERELFQGEFAERQIQFWREHLPAPLLPLKLPWDHPAPNTPSHKGAKCDFSIGPELKQKLKALSTKNAVSLFMTLLAAFKVLMRHYSGQDDVIVGTDLANRGVETEGLIGCFVNQLPIRTRVSSELTFRELSDRVRENCLACLVHGELPFDQLVDALKLERNASTAPIFQVKLVLDNTPRSELALAGLDLALLPLNNVIAKLDLTLMLAESANGINGWFEYNRDRFEPRTIAAVGARLVSLLQLVVDQPEWQVWRLLESLREIERSVQSMETKSAAMTQLAKLKMTKPKPITVRANAPAKIGFLSDGQTLPLVVEPEEPGQTDLNVWIKQNREEMERNVLKYGAVLFRGFGVATAAEFNRFALAMCPELFNENGEHPRESLGGDVYTPVFYPPDKKLLWHNENSFNHRWPLKIWFFALVPAAVGGETPLADSRQVFESLSATIRQRFLDKGVMYVRNYREGLGLDWPTVFQTSERKEVEARCRKEDIEFEWTATGHLRTSSVRPAAMSHPKTGEMVWFTQAQHWHPSVLDTQTYTSLAALFEEEDFPRHCYYGDGSPIETSVMQEICGVYEKLEVSFPWQRGDVLMLDNMLTAHARNPYQGVRKLCVAMGEMVDLKSAVLK
jgi:alpha-ketoglutarate-dependent taurine dioxygenase